jgi:hypothetical protein
MRFSVKQCGGKPRLALLTLSVLLAAPLTFAFQGAAVAPKPAVSAVLSPAEREGSKSLSVATIRDVTARLSQKDMEGRGTATPGGEKAARYIADRFAALQLKPLGDNGTFLQAVKFRSTVALPETSVKVGDKVLKFGKDFVVAPPFLSDQADASGGVVFVGYGIVSDELKRNDLEGVDVKGKIVLLRNGRPNNVDEATWKKAANPQMVAINLIRSGAAGLILTNVGTKDQPFALIADYLSRRSVSTADQPQLPFKLPPILIASNETAASIFGNEAAFAETIKKAEAGEPVSRDLEKQVTITVRLKTEETVGSNVVGFVQGIDPKLKEEAVLYTAHYDAWGVGSQGQIYPGAADNALGVGEMLGIAEAFSKLKIKPRRSIVFLAVTGEEHGLLGAEYWAKTPTWPLVKVAADINFDGVGTDVYGPVKSIVGFGMEHSNLGATLEDAAKATALVITPDPLPEEKAFYRSDHYAFVQRGVPALMLMGLPADATGSIPRMKKWLETDYHQVGDIIKPEWNWEGARTVAAIGFVIGMRVANADSMPAWNASSPFNRERGYSGPPPTLQ